MMSRIISSFVGFRTISVKFFKSVKHSRDISVLLQWWKSKPTIVIAIKFYIYKLLYLGVQAPGKHYGKFKGGRDPRSYDHVDI